MPDFETRAHLHARLSLLLSLLGTSLRCVIFSLCCLPYFTLFLSPLVPLSLYSFVILYSRNSFPFVLTYDDSPFSKSDATRPMRRPSCKIGPSLEK
jgi:hypothetical protein